LGSTRREPPGPTGGRQVILAAMGLSVEHLRDLWRARPRRVSLTPASPSPWRGRRRGSRGSGRPCRGAPVLPGSEHGHAPRGDGSTRGDPAPGRVPPSPVSGRGSPGFRRFPAYAWLVPPSRSRRGTRLGPERGQLLKFPPVGQAIRLRSLGKARDSSIPLHRRLRPARLSQCLSSWTSNACANERDRRSRNQPLGTAGGYALLPFGGGAALHFPWDIPSPGEAASPHGQGLRHLPNGRFLWIVFHMPSWHPCCSRSL